MGPVLELSCFREVMFTFQLGFFISLTDKHNRRENINSGKYVSFKFCIGTVVIHVFLNKVANSLPGKDVLQLKVFSPHSESPFILMVHGSCTRFISIWEFNIKQLIFLLVYTVKIMYLMELANVSIR